MTENTILLLSHDDGVARAALESAGFVVTDLESARPSLVILDLDDLDEPFPRIAQLRAHYEVPLLVLSAQQDPRAVVEAVRAGAQDWIRRPVQAQELRETVDQALLRQQLSLQNRSVVRLLEDQGRRVEDDRRLLQDRVAGMAAELERAHRELEDAHRELRGRVAQLVMLYRIGRDLTLHRNWDDALSSLLTSLCRFLGAKGATLLLRSQQGKVLAARSVVDLDDELVDRAIEALRLQRPWMQAEPMLYALEDVGSAAPMPCPDRRDAWESTVVPLRHRDQDLGALVLHKHYESGRSFDDDFYFLITIQTVLTEEVASAQAFSQLRKLQRFHERTLDHLNSGIVTVDETGRVVYANAMARELLGQPTTEGMVLGNYLRIGSEGPDLRQWLSGIEGATPASIEASLLRFDGHEPVPVSIVASALVGELPGETQHVCVLEDLRQRRALETERRRAARQKELLIMAAEWAHDVRTPLTGILHSAELLAGALDARSPKQRHFHVIHSEVARINGLVNHFLDYARPVALRPGKVGVATLAREVADLLLGPARARGFSLVAAVDANAEGFELMLDGDQIKQVLLNLVSNALDASPPEGEVRVCVRREERVELDEDGLRGAALVFEVTDEGQGVPDEHVDRLFVPFFTTKPEGTGLGLASSDKIVRAHGGLLRYLRVNGRTILRAVLPSLESVRVAGEILDIHPPDPLRLEARS